MRFLSSRLYRCLCSMAPPKGFESLTSALVSAFEAEAGPPRENKSDGPPKIIVVVVVHTIRGVRGKGPRDPPITLRRRGRQGATPAFQHRPGTASPPFPAYRRSRRLGLQTARNSRIHQERFAVRLLFAPPESPLERASVPSS